jgi:hypothetical protein
MDGYIVKGTLGMPRGSLLRIEDGPGLLVHVWEGELWLTQSRGFEDRVLRAGEWFRIARGGTSLAQALRRSSLSLSSPDADVPARRITLLRAGAAAPVVLHQRSPLHAWRAAGRFFTGLLAARPFQPTIS